MRLTKEVLKTIGAIALISVIVVGTFLYGNKQRQEQVRRDQEIRQQQQQASPAGSDQVAQQNSAPEQSGGDKPATGTAPVQRPSDSGNLNQQQRTQQENLARKDQSAADKPAQLAQNQPATQPGTGGSAGLPEAGSEHVLLPLMAIAVLYGINRRSKQAVKQAALRS